MTKSIKDWEGSYFWHRGDMRIPDTWRKKLHDSTGKFIGTKEELEERLKVLQQELCIEEGNVHEYNKRYERHCIDGTISHIAPDAVAELIREIEASKQGVEHFRSEIQDLLITRQIMIRQIKAFGHVI